MEQEGVMKMVICDKADISEECDGCFHRIPHEKDEYCKEEFCSNIEDEVKCVEVEP